ncbi:hypothetical protein [Algibacter sp. 2305UL17-15]|uniref:hypothetical protein n=1 Tax=Algibacter sp. 2305UL17-15 TaxID=3231268 RepID=UPI003459BB77
MTKKGTLFIILFFLFSIQYTNSQQKHFFEGIITYKIESNDNGYGDTLTVYIKDGYIKNLYNTKHKGGIKEEILHPDKGMMYMKLVGVDTLYTYNIKKNDSSKLIEITNKESIEENILGRKCNMIEFKTKNIIDNNDYIFVYKYYYSPDYLKLNIERFENYNFGYASTVYSKAKSHCLKYEMTSPAFHLKYIAIHILHKKLDSSLFNIDTNTPLKEFKI